MAPVGFESTILAGERPQTHAIPDRNTKFNISLDVSVVSLVEYYINPYPANVENMVSS
jgi:hypothetical protein